jgi:UDP-glucose 4-epimerase
MRCDEDEFIPLAMADLYWRPRFPELAAIIASAWRWHQAHFRPADI